MSDIIHKRQSIFVPPEGSVDIRVEFGKPVNDEGGGFYGFAFLVCKTCNYELDENREKCIWECPECGYELTAAELEALGRAHLHAIRNSLAITEDRKRGFLWRFLRLLGIKAR